MKKILIVDDEQDIRDTLRVGLVRHKYDALTAASGEEALGVCKTIKPDLILIDIAMPGMDGYETCTLLRKDPRTRNTPVIFLTGKDLDPKGIIARYEILGASGYLVKPSTLHDVLAKIKEVIGE